MKWIAVALFCGGLVVAEERVSFNRDLAPVLLARCVACHGAEKAKGKYRVDTFAGTIKAVAAGDAEESELFKRLVTNDPDDRMPQEDEPLSPGQIELFRRWIAEGAKLESGSPDDPLNMLVPRRAHAAAPKVYPRAVPVVALAFHPAGQLLAVNGYNEITVWDLNGELQRRIAPAPPRIRGLAFDPAGGHLAAVGGTPGREGELSIYSADTGALETTLARAADELLAVAFSPDGKWLAAGGADNSIHIFSWDTREKISTIQQHADWVTAISFNGDGSRLASASRDRTARVYDARSGELETTYPTHKAPLFAVGFLPDGSVASGGRDKEVHFWKTEDGKKKNEVKGFKGEVYQLVVSGENVFTACSDGLARQHGTGDRKLIRAYAGHADAVFAIAVHGPAARLASGGYDGEVRIWNTADGALSAIFVAAPGLTK
jgi:hypothetical protein